LTAIVNDIRTVQIPALKDRELVMLEKIDEVRQTESPAIQTARDEIQRLRKSAEDQVAQSQALIERLQKQLANTDNRDDIQKAIDEQNDRVRTASSEIETLTDKKFQLESEYRKLEAEVGPIKYIAEFIYGEQADKNLLEEAVRWVIITIIFVFDPLAVLLLIASQYTFDYNRRFKDDSGERLRQEYEQLRAQRIIDNPGYNTDDPKEDEEEKVDVTEPTTTTDDDLGDMVSENDTTNPNEADTRVEQPEIQTNEDSKKQIADSYLSVQEALETPVEEAVDKSIDIEKKDQESSEELERLSEEEFDALDENLDWKTAKTQWKSDNPNETLKEYKELYLTGVINELPWEAYLPEGIDLKKKKRYIMKEKGKQIRKETDD